MNKLLLRGELHQQYTDFSYFFSGINTVLFFWVHCLTTALNNCNTLSSWCPIFYLPCSLSIDACFPRFSSLWTMEIVLDTLVLPNFVPSFLRVVFSEVFIIHAVVDPMGLGVVVGWSNSSVYFSECFSVRKLPQTLFSWSLLPSFSADQESTMEETLSLYFSECVS